MGKVLSIPRQAIGNSLLAFICLYLGISREKILFYSLMKRTDKEGGVFGGSSMFKKLDEN